MTNAREPVRVGRNLELTLADPAAPTSVRALVARFGSPLMVIDLAAVRRQFAALSAALPGVALHYALKTLPDERLVRALAAEGARFDLATTGEVALVGRLGIHAERCIHTHPIKQPRDIAQALAYGVSTFVVDNPDEIAKFVPFRAAAQVLLRVSFRSPNAVSDLSKKFGCTPDDTLGLLEVARAAGVDVAGLTFHVGSQVVSPDAHVKAVGACGALITEARRRGFQLRILDIGGGFPVTYRSAVPEIAAFCAPISRALALLPDALTLIAEPGRFLAAPAGIAVTTVTGRAQRGDKMWYYLDDGVYGTFSGRMFEAMEYPIEVVGRHEGAIAADAVADSVLAGPTCDSADVVAESLLLPRLDIGDHVVARMAGAYTSASATDFNFVPRARVVHVNGS